MAASEDSSAGLDSDPAAVLVEVVLFNLFASLGAVWLSAVLITAVAATSIRRSKLWFAHLGAWAVYAFSYLVLVGHQVGPAPPHALCLFQAGLIYASPPMSSVAGLCFLLDTYLGGIAVLWKKHISPRWSTALVILPYIFGTLALVCVLLFADPSTVQRHPSHLYCHITVPPFALVAAILVIVSGSLMLCFEACILVLLWKKWPEFRRLSKTDSRHALSMFVRFGLFSLVFGFGLGLGAFTISAGNSSVRYWSVLLPTVSILAALTYGTQMDILRVWMFWRRRAPLEGFKTKVQSGPREAIPNVV
ncbi:hypothetical protein C8R46DRAFT_1116815 [Mycena filopes]|nr:hypothetical protein C8R46DRAFT_1116815 [Mycena filopes]